MQNKFFRNIPNMLSIARGVFTPVLYYLVLTGQNIAFVIAFILIGLTDFVDGKIARRYNLTSKLGMYLDTYADMIYFLSCIAFLYFLAKDYFMPNLAYLMIVVLLFVVVVITSLVKFKKLLLLHTYISKACGVLIFALVVLSAFFDTTYFITFVITIYLISFSEQLAIFIKFGEVEFDTTSIFTAKNFLVKEET